MAAIYKPIYQIINIISRTAEGLTVETSVS